MNPLSFTPATATGGGLFNRKDTRGLDGEVVPVLDRNGEPTDKHNYVFKNGRDITGLADRHRLKMRIPATSVVNKVGDIKFCLCFGWRLTAAQWIWILNSICFLAHTTMVVLTAYFAWWSKDLDKYDEDPNLVRIYRVSAIWDNSTQAGYRMAIVDNQMPFNLAWGVISFFGLSAIFHLFALAVGLFESTWLWYFRQMDDAFCWWRWAE
tara:strand:- start:1627 stop:2253 length:627 start_codon:yes stop_codon:yes gene_type:complete